jgi:ribosome recycling factor
MSVKEVIQQTEVKMKKSIESAKREFSEVRTGRAHPGLIEGMHIDYFGTLTLLKQLASISVPDPRTVIIQPWDPSVIPELEKAIANSNLGATATNDGKIVRLSIPALSEERRKELAKVVKEMAEKSRISLRTIRRDANDKLKKLQADKTITEDDHFKSQESIQKLTDKYIKEIDDLLEDKSKALTELNV